MFIVRLQEGKDMEMIRRNEFCVPVVTNAPVVTGIVGNLIH